MFKPKENETIVLALHRHWFVIAGKMTLISVMLMLPIILIPIIIGFVPEIYTTLSFFFISIYILIVLLIAFIFWVDYYLDMWIVTDERIIDIEQHGLFRREISEFMLSRIQDVTVEIPNFFATVLKFGNIIVQTAGDKPFVARDIPNVGEAKDIILEQAKKSKLSESSNL